MLFTKYDFSQTPKFCFCCPTQTLAFACQAWCPIPHSPNIIRSVPPLRVEHLPSTGISIQCRATVFSDEHSQWTIHTTLWHLTTLLRTAHWFQEQWAAVQVFLCPAWGVLRQLRRWLAGPQLSHSWCCRHQVGWLSSPAFPHAVFHFVGIRLVEQSCPSCECDSSKPSLSWQFPLLDPAGSW